MGIRKKIAIMMFCPGVGNHLNESLGNSENTPSFPAIKNEIQDALIKTADKRK